MEQIRTPQPPAWPAKAPRQDSAWSVLRLLFALFFGSPFTRLFNELETLFAAWRAGTLPPLPAPRPAPARLARILRPRASRRHSYVRRTTTAGRTITTHQRPRALFRQAASPPPTEMFAAELPASRKKRVFCPPPTHAHFVSLS